MAPLKASWCKPECRGTLLQKIIALSHHLVCSWKLFNPLYFHHSLERITILKGNKQTGTNSNYLLPTTINMWLKLAPFPLKKSTKVTMLQFKKMKSLEISTQRPKNRTNSTWINSWKTEGRIMPLQQEKSLLPSTATKATELLLTQSYFIDGTGYWFLTTLFKHLSEESSY